MATNRRMPDFAEALGYWFKLGWVSFGGPAGQIALMHEDLVERRRWISDGRFLHALNYCMVLPGPEAQQLATYIGWLMHGTRGGIAAGALFVLPSLLILIVLSWAYLRFGQTVVVSAIFYGIKPAVVAIVLAAAWRIGRRVLAHPALWAISAAALIAVHWLGWTFPLVLALAAIAGAMLGKFWPRSIADRPSGAARASALQVDYLIGDYDAPPAHAVFRLGRTLAMIAVFIAIWAVVIVALASAFGGAGETAVQLAWLHTKAALLTFGGAYAVLPYLFQSTVEHYHWLTAAQMMDGMALGETTPGPLIMIVAFIGFLAGASVDLLRVDELAASGAVGATIATFFTFLPSFMFILAGAPFIEGTRHQLRLKGPLTGISAAVVGVIVSLAIFFAQHVFMPGDRQTDWIAVAIAAASLIALVRYKRGVIETLFAAATAGIAVRALAGGFG
jgi:chromate transporter